MRQQGNKQYAVGVDVGGSHVCSAVVDLTAGQITGEPCVTPMDSKSDASQILEALVSNIIQVVSKSGVGQCISGVGLAFPGPFDYVHGISTVHGVEKFERIFGLDVRSSLYSRLCSHGIGDFKFVNDASAFALGESAAGAAKGVSRVVAITLGTGVGSGFVADGELVETGEEVPAFGWVYHLPFEGGIVDEAFSTRWICRRYAELGGRAVSGAKEVADRCACGEKAAKALFEEYGARFAAFAAPVLKRFRAEMLVLGGNISRAYGHFGPALEKGLEQASCGVRVRTSALLDHAAMVGAASLFSHEK